MNFRSILLALLVLLPSQGFAHAATHGFYSRPAQYLWDNLAFSPTHLVVASPDRRSRAIIRWHGDGGENNEEHTTVETEGAIGTSRTDIRQGVGLELLWAPDSSAFFINTSFGGATGDFHLFVIGNFEGRLQSREITQLIYKNYGHPVRCDPQSGGIEPPNVAGISWIPNTRNPWVAAEVIPHSLCDSMGTFRAYEVEPYDMVIVRKINQLDAKRELWPVLGQELRRASNSCIRSPKSCYVVTNHPELYVPSQH